MNSASKIISAAAILTVLSCPAKAATVEYVISGTVLGGYDYANVFGGGDLTGKSFLASETFETTNAASSYANAAGSGANGGASTNGLNFISVGLTIGGVSKRFSDYTSNVSVSAGIQFNSSVQSAVNVNKDNIGFYIASPSIAADYTQQRNLSGLADAYAGFYTLTDATGKQVVFANFEVTGLTAVSAVPLPASAPLFGAALLALGTVGYGVKRKKAAPAV